MAAGLGFKTFTTGEVLTAGDVNGYLMQGINVFASSAARAAAITSPQEGQYSFLKDTNALEYYDGAAWVGAPVGDITAVNAGTGISGGGASGAVTITNSMATEITASGDIIVGTGSGTFDNLPIGTTGQLLTADTTVSPYKVKWASPAPAASGMTLINRTAYTASATINVDSVFSSTYYSYMVVMEGIGSGSGSTDNMRIKMRYSGNTETGALYYGNCLTTQHYNTTITNTAGSGLTYWTTALQIGSVPTGDAGRCWYQFQGVGANSEKPVFFGNHYTTANTQNDQAWGGNGQARVYDGFQVSTSGGNTIVANIAVYGLAKA